MSNNSADIFKAMANTASVIVTTPANGMSSSEMLLKNNAYKAAIHSTLRRQETNSLIHRHAKHGGSVGSRPQHGRSSERRHLNDITDDMLQDIPAKDGLADEVFSLFQGFNAVLPEINEALEMIRDGKLLEDDVSSSGSAALPKGITEDKIRTSQNSKQLAAFRDDINYKLDLLEIKKGLSSNEIVEIDGKIRALQAARQQVFDKVKKFEQDEIYLENELYEIESRLRLIKNVDVDVDVDAGAAGDADGGDGDGAANVTRDSSTDSNDEGFQMVGGDDVESNLMTKSIYGKLRKETSKANRKTKPTLQTYYEPGSVIERIEAHDDAITSLDFDIPFGTAVTASLDNTVRVWDLSRGRCLGLLEGHNAAVKCLKMEDNLVVTGSLDASLKLWDLQKLNNADDSENESPMIHSFDSHVEEITALDFHKTVLVSGSSDRTIRQWDLNTGHCVQTIDVLWAATQNSLSHSQFLSASASAPSPLQAAENAAFIGAVQVYDAALATGTADGVVRLWDLRSGEVIRQLVGHTGPVTSLQFDDKNLTTGSADRSIRIWDLRTGGIVDAFAYDSPISCLQFDSRRIVSTNHEASLKIYDRIEERHWTCAAGDTVNFLRYKDSYVVGGCASGELVSFAV